ncbi:MAG: IPTL-CTERM sorting domain-containing protein [Thermodesulfobacteriota bacterium]
MVKQYAITILAGVLALGFLSMAFPETSNAQEESCCQYVNTQTSSFSCVFSVGEFGCPIPVGDNPIEFISFLQGSSCDKETGLCSGFEPNQVRDVPTLSEWGLIAMAGVLGVV